MRSFKRKFRRHFIWPIELYLIHHWFELVLYCFALLLGMIIGVLIVECHTDRVFISPVGSGVVQMPFTWELQEIKKGKMWSGLASYYSREGCVGCSKNLHMANGEPLNDENLTVAFNRLKLGSKILITNLKIGTSVVSEVTDRGGFEHLGRIIDLNLATKNAIKCSDLCRIKIEEIL